MRWPALLLVLALAGCADAGGPATAGTPSGPRDTVVQGVVVDAAIRPVEGAIVTAEPGAPKASTDANGAFVLALEPGAFVLTATHPSYAPVRVDVQVAAGRPTGGLVLRFDLPASQAPYSTLAKFDGFIVCSLAASVIFSEECGEGVGTPVGRVGKQGNNAIRYDFQPDSPDLQTAIVEQVWTPTSEAGTQLSVVFATAWTCEPACGGEGVGEGSVQGPSPLLLRADREALEPHLADPAAVFTTYTLALTDVVAANVVLNQPFQLFVSLFYREAAPEGYSFVAASS